MCHSKKSHFGEGITAENMTKLRWLKPKLVGQVQFAEWSSYGLAASCHLRRAVR
jgi:hypothetical protein